MQSPRSLCRIFQITLALTLSACQAQPAGNLAQKPHSGAVPSTAARSEKLNLAELQKKYGPFVKIGVEEDIFRDYWQKKYPGQPLPSDPSWLKGFEIQQSGGQNLDTSQCTGTVLTPESGEVPYSNLGQLRDIGIEYFDINTFFCPPSAQYSGFEGVDNCYATGGVPVYNAFHICEKKTEDRICYKTEIRAHLLECQREPIIIELQTVNSLVEVMPDGTIENPAEVFVIQVAGYSEWQIWLAGPDGVRIGESSGSGSQSISFGEDNNGQPLPEGHYSVWLEYTDENQQLKQVQTTIEVKWAAGEDDEEYECELGVEPATMMPEQLAPLIDKFNQQIDLPAEILNKYSQFTERLAELQAQLAAFGVSVPGPPTLSAPFQILNADNSPQQALPKQAQRLLDKYHQVEAEQQDYALQMSSQLEQINGHLGNITNEALSHYHFQVTQNPAEVDLSSGSFEDYKETIDDYLTALEYQIDYQNSFGLLEAVRQHLNLQIFYNQLLNAHLGKTLTQPDPTLVSDPENYTFEEVAQIQDPLKLLRFVSNQMGKYANKIGKHQEKLNEQVESLYQDYLQQEQDYAQLQQDVAALEIQVAALAAENAQRETEAAGGFSTQGYQATLDPGHIGGGGTGNVIYGPPSVNVKDFLKPGLGVAKLLQKLISTNQITNSHLETLNTAKTNTQARINKLTHEINNTSGSLKAQLLQKRSEERTLLKAIDDAIALAQKHQNSGAKAQGKAQVNQSQAKSNCTNPKDCAPGGKNNQLTGKLTPLGKKILKKGKRHNDKMPLEGGTPNGYAYKIDQTTGKISGYIKYNDKGEALYRVRTAGGTHGGISPPITTPMKPNPLPDGTTRIGELTNQARPSTPAESPYFFK